MGSRLDRPVLEVHHSTAIREVLLEVLRGKKRFRGAAAVARIVGRRWRPGRQARHRVGSHLSPPPQALMSIACRSPSLTRLKDREQTKIAAPGSAQMTGCT